MNDFDYNSEKKCIKCQTSEYFVTTPEGSLVCSECGMESLSRMISSGQDWNNYEDGIDNSRVSYIDTSNPYASCGSYIKPKSYIILGKKPDGSILKMDLSKIHTRISYSSKQKSFDTVAKEFTRLEDIGVSKKVIDTAKRYWGKIMDGNIHRGANRKGIMASCIVYSCFENKCAMSRKDVAKLMLCEKEDITKGEYLFIDMIKGTTLEYILKYSSNTEDMFLRNLSKFDSTIVTYTHTKMCKELYMTYHSQFESMRPESVIAGIICYVLKTQEKLKKPTKGEICSILSVSNPTINNMLSVIKNLIESDTNKPPIDEL